MYISPSGSTLWIIIAVLSSMVLVGALVGFFTYTEKVRIFSTNKHNKYKWIINGKVPRSTPLVYTWSFPFIIDRFFVTGETHITCRKKTNKKTKRRNICFLSVLSKSSALKRKLVCLGSVIINNTFFPLAENIGLITYQVIPECVAKLSAFRKNKGGHESIFKIYFGVAGTCTPPTRGALLKW